MTGQMSLDDFGISTKVWEYDEDTGMVMCRCPECGGRMSLGCYTYWNSYNFCPYCGEQLAEGKLVGKICEVYKHDRETVERVRREFGK